MSEKNNQKHGKGFSRLVGGQPEPESYKFIAVSTCRVKQGYLLVVTVFVCLF
jgi:hypothetical protein